MVRTITVRMHKVTVGWSELEARDAATGVAAGAFRPGPGYELVEPIFRLFAEAHGGAAPPARPVDAAKLERYYAARDRLALTVHAPDGTAIETHSVHVADFRAEGGPEAIELEVVAATPAAWAALTGAVAAPHLAAPRRT